MKKEKGLYCPYCGEDELHEHKDEKGVFFCDNCDSVYVKDQESTVSEMAKSEPTVVVTKVSYPNDGVEALHVAASVGPKAKGYIHEFRFHREDCQKRPSQTIAKFGNELKDWMDSMVTCHREALEHAVCFQLGEQVNEIVGAKAEVTEDD